MVKPRNKKNEQSKQGPDQAPCSPNQKMLGEANEEEDPPNRAVPAAITALRNEVTQIKKCHRPPF